MYWQEKSTEKSFDIPDTVLDLSFKIECKSLPIDHAWALSQALISQLPWLKTTQNSAIHLIHGAESGNGWLRPEAHDADGVASLIHLSRRARFHLRLHKDQLEQAKEMIGLELDIDGYSLNIKDFKQQLLMPQSTIFARYVACDEGASEDQFLDQIAPSIQAMGIRIQKMLGGKKHQFNTPHGMMHTRSLMLAELEKEESIALQQAGIGEHQLMGMGIFLPHKGITAVTDLNEELPPIPEA